MSTDANLKCFHLLLKEDAAQLKIHLSRGFDFQAFLSFCVKNSLLAHIHPALSLENISPLFPDTLLELSKTRHVLQWSYNESLVQGMEKVRALFSNAGIQTIFLKGPLMAERFYGHIGGRVTRDIDILVRPADIAKADEILMTDGFKRTSHFLFGRAVTACFAHHFEYEKGPWPVELHWALARHFSFRIDYEEIWSRSEKFSFRENDYQVLSDENELLAQILSIYTDIPLGGLILKQFADIYKIIENFEDDSAEWELFFEERKKERLFKIAVNILDLVLQTLGAADDFPGLSKVLRRHEAIIELRNQKMRQDLLDNARSLRGRFWSFKLCETSMIKAMAWWGISLPFRLCAYPAWARQHAK